MNTVPSLCAPFQIVLDLNFASGVEDIGHNDEVNPLSLTVPYHFDFVQPQDSCDQCMWIAQHVIVVVLHDT